MPTRDFPFSPRNTRQLEAGDLVAVPCEPQGWACLQVVELKRKGPGSLKSLIVGPLPWFGEAPPTDQDAEGVPVTEQGTSMSGRSTTFGGGRRQFAEHEQRPKQPKRTRVTVRSERA